MYDPADLLVIDVVPAFTPDVCVLRLAGEVDMLTAPLLESALAEQLACGAGSLVLDLSEVTFLCGAGFGLLIAAAASAAERGVDLHLVLSASTLRIAKLLSIEQFITTHAVRTAVAA